MIASAAMLQALSGVVKGASRRHGDQLLAIPGARSRRAQALPPLAVEALAHKDGRKRCSRPHTQRDANVQRQRLDIRDAASTGIDQHLLLSMHMHLDQEEGSKAFGMGLSKHLRNLIEFYQHLLLSSHMHVEIRKKGAKHAGWDYPTQWRNGRATCLTSRQTSPSGGRQEVALRVVFGQVLVNTSHPAMTAMTCPIERTH